MYIQCSTVHRNGKTSRNRKLVRSYRDPLTKQPRVKTVQKIEKLPLLERSRLIYQHGGQKYLRAEEWQALCEAGELGRESVSYDLEVGDIYKGGGTAVGYYHLKESGLFTLLNKTLSKGSSSIICELVLSQLLYPNSKVCFSKQRKHSLLYLESGKRHYKEDVVYNALDELAGKMPLIKKGLTDLLPGGHTELLLYDLSNSYFTGNKAELGGRGDSKEKRHDRYIVSYGLVMNQNNMPMDIRIWKGGTADAKTVLSTFKQWKEHYKAQRAIWVADRAMSGVENIEQITGLGLHYITGLPANTQQAKLLYKIEQQPELFDQRGISSFEQDNKRYLLCRHHSKGYRLEQQHQIKRRKVYNQLIKIQNSPQNKDAKKLYHRAMRVIENYEQTAFWNVNIEPVKDQQDVLRYRLSFTLNRQAVINHDSINHYYLLQTDLNHEQMSDLEVQQSYKDLIKVERSFRDIKTHINVRPIRHRKERRIKAHLYLCFLSLWLSKYMENLWRDRGIDKEIAPVLNHWDNALLICEKIDDNGQVREKKWNRGVHALQTIEQIEKYGESQALKPYS